MSAAVIPHDQLDRIWLNPLLNTPELLPHAVAAGARRAKLSSDWPTAAQVSSAMGSLAADPSELATQLRRNGQLLGVYVMEPTEHYRFPSWQFQSDGQPVKHFAEILTIIRVYGMRLGESRRTSGWGEVEWFLSHHVLLGGDRPCDLLRKNPGAVLEAARGEFIEDNNSGGF